MLGFSILQIAVHLKNQCISPRFSSGFSIYLEREPGLSIGPQMQRVRRRNTVFLIRKLRIWSGITKPLDVRISETK